MEEANDTSAMNYTLPTTVVSSINNLTSSLSTELLTAGTTTQLYNDTTTTSTTITTESYTQSSTETASQQSTWNLTRVGESLPKVATTVSGSLCTTTLSTTTTEDNFDEFGPPEGVEYIFVPLGVMIFVIILSAVVSFSYFWNEQKDLALVGYGEFRKAMFTASGNNNIKEAQIRATAT